MNCHLIQPELQQHLFLILQHVNYQWFIKIVEILKFSPKSWQSSKFSNLSDFHRLFMQYDVA